ncbi:hypothetical protein FA95DRAFT_1601703 [Auriscalpium vulgare]|uniref:Uncharacterized protein n=1 Tax=Auriscalpium vulgare TaxID=40419 RepID=A0ACB8S9S2_9AGAM|nr:hypothetical protein FA95DRAFT_1601703 [Auriscalpium vulgare]
MAPASPSPPVNEDSASALHELRAALPFLLIGVVILLVLVLVYASYFVLERKHLHSDPRQVFMRPSHSNPRADISSRMINTRVHTLHASMDFLCQGDPRSSPKMAWRHALSNAFGKTSDRGQVSKTLANFGDGFAVDRRNEIVKRRERREQAVVPWDGMAEYTFRITPRGAPEGILLLGSGARISTVRGRPSQPTTLPAVGSRGSVEPAQATYWQQPTLDSPLPVLRNSHSVAPEYIPMNLDMLSEGFSDTASTIGADTLPQPPEGLSTPERAYAAQRNIAEQFMQSIILEDNGQYPRQSAETNISRHDSV